MIALALSMSVVALIIVFVLSVDIKTAIRANSDVERYARLRQALVVRHCPLRLARVTLDVGQGSLQTRAWVVPTDDEEVAREIVTKQLQYLADTGGLVGPRGQVCEEFSIWDVTLDTALSPQHVLLPLPPGWKS